MIGLGVQSSIGYKYMIETPLMARQASNTPKEFMYVNVEYEREIRVSPKYFFLDELQNSEKKYRSVSKIMMKRKNIEIFLLYSLIFIHRRIVWSLPSKCSLIKKKKMNHINYLRYFFL